jgi:hypothetical protein
MNVWWRYFRDHGAKSGLNAMVTATGEELAQLPVDWQLDVGEGLNALKLRALYVDYLDGAFVLPDDAIEEADGLNRRILNLASHSVLQHETHLNGIREEDYEATAMKLALWLTAYLQIPPRPRNTSRQSPRGGPTIQSPDRR